MFYTFMLSGTLKFGERTVYIFKIQNKENKQETSFQSALLLTATMQSSCCARKVLNCISSVEGQGYFEREVHYLFGI